MKFGLLKSKIEKILVESYRNNSLKKDLFVFNELVVKNKNISKLYYLYDELNSNKGLNESLANEFVNQSIVVYENTINKVKPSEFKELQMWVNHVNCKNDYQTIDNFFTNSVTNLLEKIESKNQLLESLKSKPLPKVGVVNVPLSTMVNVVNKTINSHIDNLSESDKKELKKLLSEDDDTIKESFLLMKGSVIGKLEKLQESENDREVSQKINETLEKVKMENFDKLSYLKLKKLNENL